MPRKSRRSKKTRKSRRSRKTRGSRRTKKSRGSRESEMAERERLTNAILPMVAEWEAVTCRNEDMPRIRLMSEEPLSYVRKVYKKYNSKKELDDLSNRKSQNMITRGSPYMCPDLLNYAR